MADKLLEWISGAVDTEQYSIAPGIVKNNLDLLGEGRVQVRIPSRPAFSPWARLLGLGGGAEKGFFWVPQLDDEVLVAFNQNDERDAYILGGLWSMMQRPPVLLPFDQLRKRVIKTGLIGGIGHEIEFDDVLQSITITSSTEQKITIDPFKIQLSAAFGLITITLGVKPTMGISIEALGNIELKAPLGKISLQALEVEVKGTLKTEVKTDLGPCVIQGLPVKIN